MNNKELLLSKRWIVKRDNREQYYKIKDEAKTLKKIFQDTLGYSLISHQDFIKLDKVPGKAEPWMGICDFHSLEEYQIFCYVLLFLEDRDPEEQFILSYLTEFIQMQLGVDEKYWLKFANRKKFVNVLKFCLKEQLLLQDDGDTERFIQSENIEVLFENTGLSRYFMRNFVANIFEFETPQDFMREKWVGLEQDRGIVRRQRIYRRLMLSCGIYKEEDDKDDFSFIHNYRKRIQNDFQNICPCDLHVYKSSAFLVLEDEVKVGRLFPKNNAMDEMIVIIMSNLRKRIKNSDLKKDENDILILSQTRLKTTIERMIKENEKYLPATYRQKNREIFVEELYQYMIQLGFAQEDNENMIIYPVIGKLVGNYEEV
ncbi:MAG: TIGR02678 family protein [Coprobacillus cateniformis]|uniref:TIGR02678 family protein n=1 Tax=Longibaculum muris TaxID=1796628 RepID=UPI003AB3194F|nr:TIGR02678 family protein [Coprobacillus cateniformis]